MDKMTSGRNENSTDILFDDVLKSINAYLLDAAGNAPTNFGYPLNKIGQCEDAAEYLKKIIPLYIDSQIESYRLVFGSPNEEERIRLRQKPRCDK